ncbi:MAG: histidinol-phosphatase [Spirochaetia bacterium]|jgi:histidinol-phosphatase (PHP family)
MPGFSNYHTHTYHCDGRGEPREYAEAALRKGMPRLGFSGHNVVPFPTDWTMPAARRESYLGEVREVRERYRGKLEIFLGMEVDFIPGMITPLHPDISALGLDFVIGSVHFVGPSDGDHAWTVDGPREEMDAAVRDGFGGDPRRLIERYYRLVAAMAETAAPDIFAHFDIVKKNNRDGRFFSEEEAWYRAAVKHALDAVRESGKVMEINTGGVVRNTSGAFYPSPWILQEARQMGIPVLVSADAHHPDHIDGKFAEAVQLLRGVGYRTQRQLTRGGWIDLEL